LVMRRQTDHREQDERDRIAHHEDTAPPLHATSSQTSVVCAAVATVIGFRHGMVENPNGVIYARLPGFPLAAHGLEQAERLGRLLAPAPVSAVCASPLDRAVQTAKALAEPHGLEVITDDRLLEWSFWIRWAGTP